MVRHSDFPSYICMLIAYSGHVFAGASIPYGMAKAGADSDSVDNQGGFASADSTVNITGFSSMHDSVCSNLIP